ncbi:unnamed protein product [Urochloa humidicola]
MGKKTSGGPRSKAEVVVPGKFLSLEVQSDSNCGVDDGSTIGEGDMKIGFSGIAARCSFSQMFDVVNGFDAAKRALVEETGFGGLLKFPALKQIDRRFALWLMCRVDVVARTLVLDESRKIKLNKCDVSHVFGVPCTGRLVAAYGRPGRDVVCKVSAEYLGLSPREVRSIKAAQEVLTRVYGEEMSEAECCAFKAAFVIYVMSTVLAPGAKHDYLSVDYWGAIVDTDEITSYDWADYVLRRLFESVIKLKNDLKGRGKVANITGCSLFLQVIYLDSIDTGAWTMLHNVFPRICAFRPDILKSMIRIDTINSRSDGYERRFGKNKIRDEEGVCYSWAANQNTAGA